MRVQRGFPRQLLGSGLFLVVLTMLAVGSSFSSPTSVTIAGDLQSELGCPGDWQPECAATHLTYSADDDVWQSTFDLPSGGYLYKAALNDSWTENYGAGGVPGGDNIPLNLGAQTMVKFYYDDKSHWVTDNVNSVIATAAGSFQSEMGCPGDWQPECLRSWLQDLDGDGLYTLMTTDLPAGDYEAKVTINESWSENYGAGGVPGGDNIPFSVPADNTPMLFAYDAVTHILTIAEDGGGSGPDSVTIAGSLQSELGCPGDWQPECSNTFLSYDAADDVWQAIFDIPVGSYEYKAALNGSWDENYGAGGVPGGDNIPLNLGAQSMVKFYYDHKSHWVTDNVTSVIATAAGSFQSEMGCPGDWQPDCLRSWLQDLDGDGAYSFTTEALPAGDYEAKTTINESWAENYGAGGVPGGDNIPFSVPADNTPMTFSYDAVSHILTISAGSGAGHDNNIFWDDLGHDSRDAAYRTPGGPVAVNTPVTVRLRAASGDLTQAKVRYWNDRLNVQYILNMYLAADDGVYEWWEATLPASADATIYWYRFIALDGSATAYYEDNATRDGGWGQPYAESADNSWQVTMYDPSFQTPDWVKNGIIYQIFPDRFRDGDTGNDPAAGRFFYGEEGGTIVRSNSAEWNTFVCNPRDANDCPGTYSRNFYGGDLQGIIDKIADGYFSDLGVTVLYLNPIFESPSNHKYDTTDYAQISVDFGDEAAFMALVEAAHAHGMQIILDGVFNHTSSDSVYFDRYSRYDAAGNLTSPDGPGVNDSSGACESPSSPYRAWYYFTDVPAGTGPCVGADGTPNAATYTSWFGFDSLPKLNSADPDVRAYIWSAGVNSIAPYYMQYADGWRLDVGGDIDPGVTNDPNNNYWEGFRDAVRAANPNAYIVLEEWGNASAWLLGQEMDATMNYQYSSAMLSFWRDTPFTDNDHNNGSSAGPLNPITPSELDARLRNWQERYPEQAFYAMLNLLGSHDTNRPLFFLDHNAANGTDPALLLDPNYDWSDAIMRLKGVALLQMTLPGAPTIYYGDEVGLVGPTYYDGSSWQDDPYNRQPFPWLDESGAPFYTHLQSEAGQNNLRDYYRTLTHLRLDHPALRTGSFTTLLVDDNAMLYAYGRKLADNADAAIVIVNRGAAAQDVTLQLAGYLPVGAEWQDAFSGALYTVAGDGTLTVNGLAGNSGTVLALEAPAALPPDAAADLAVVAERNGEVDLTWSAAAGADSYDLYRSLLSGGGYEWVANTTGLAYTDTGLTNAVAYYYVVVSRNDTNLLTGGYSNEAMGIPQHDLSTAWYNLQWPPAITHTISAITPTVNIYGQLWINGETGGSGPATGIIAQVGYAATGIVPPDPEWIWVNMLFNAAVGNNDEYFGNLLPDRLGDFDYVTRWSSDGGRTWYYSDLSGPGLNGNPGRLHVIAGSDTTPPAAPVNLMHGATSPSSITIFWDANSEPDLIGYEVYRQTSAGRSGFVRIAQVDAATTSYTDIDVVSGTTYDYYVLAFDASFNRSDPSNIVTATAETRLVAVTFRVGVPAYTPGAVYMSGNISQLGPWSANGAALTQVGPTTWEVTLSIEDGTALEFKFTRGEWSKVERWGAITGFANRHVSIDYGMGGTQLVDLTATDWGNGPDETKAVRDWEDPIVVSFSPGADAADVPIDAPISVTWNHTMTLSTVFEVTGPGGAVSGAFSYDAGLTTVTFTPDGGLMTSTAYTVSVTGQTDYRAATQQVPAAWNFTTAAPNSAEFLTFSGQNRSALPALVGLGALAMGGWLWHRRNRQA